MRIFTAAKIYTDQFYFIRVSNADILEHEIGRCAIPYTTYFSQRKGRFPSALISHLSLNREGRWGTTDDFATSFLHFSLFSTALGDLANCWPVHSLMLFPHLFLCLPCLLLPSTDTIDHYILLHRLQFLCGISGTVLSWLESYLTGRTRTVTMNDRSSRPADVSFGVPWGSVLGPIPVSYTHLTLPTS